MMPDSPSGNQLVPKVSIVIVNFNGYDWLKKFMPGLVYDTDYPSYEVIVVDNASGDRSVEYLSESFDNVRIVTLKENLGFAAGSNIGSSYATGEILAFLNNDIEISRNWLEKAVSTLRSDNKIAAVQCKILYYYDHKRIDCIGLSSDRYNIEIMIGHDEIDEGQYDTWKEIGACSGGAMLIWTNIFRKIGCFDVNYFMYNEDIDLSWRIKLAGYRIAPATASTVYHVGSASSNINSTSRWNPSLSFARCDKI